MRILRTLIFSTVALIFCLRCGFCASPETELSADLKKLKILNAQLKTGLKELGVQLKNETESSLPKEPKAESDQAGLADLTRNIPYRDKDETAKLYRELGTAYTKAKLFEPAIAAYERSLELGPDDAETHYNLGILYRHYLKDSKKSFEHLEKYLLLNSQAPNKKEVEYLIKMMEELN